MAIRTLRLQEKEHRKSAKEDLKKFRSWQDNSIVRAYRESMIAKLMYIRAEILYEDKKSLIVKAALRVCIKTSYRYIILNFNNINYLIK